MKFRFRFADCIAHRMLAAAIGIEELPQTLTDKQHVTELCNGTAPSTPLQRHSNLSLLLRLAINYRHHQAQLAGRASAEVHTMSFFRGKVLQEVGRVLKVRQNGVVILVPRYGVEAIAYVAAKDQPSQFVFDQQGQALHSASLGITLRQFDSVQVELRLDASTLYRQKLQIAFIDPPVPRVGPAPVPVPAAAAAAAAAEVEEDAMDVRPEGQAAHLASVTAQQPSAVASAAAPAVKKAGKRLKQM
jgi:exosome complex exonuclease DIS3/RRP44